MRPKGYTAELIAAEIMKKLESLKIDKNKLIGQSYDGASVMSGNAGGVQRIVRNTYPFAFYVHCYAHQLNLILEKCASINHTVRSFFCNLHAFPSFFTRSPKRSAFLKEIVNRRIPAAPQTRWNYNTRTVKIIHDNLESLKECMDSLLKKRIHYNRLCRRHNNTDKRERRKCAMRGDALSFPDCRKMV